MAKHGSSTDAEPLLQSFDGTPSSDTEAEPCLSDANEAQEIVSPQTDAHFGTGKVEWGMMTFVMLGDMFGLGCLTLPTDFAQLGWAIALPLIALCSMGMLYSGRLFTILGLKVPRARVFADFGTMTLGKRGQHLVYIFIYSTVMLNPIMLQLTSVESLLQVLYRTSIDRWTGGIIVAFLILPLSMVQGLEDMAGLSTLGSVGMLVAVLVALVKLVIMGDPQPTEAVHKPTSFHRPVVAILDIIFAYGGQQNWARFLTQMRYRSHFPRSVGSAAFTMSCIYIVTGAIGYARLGKNFDSGKPLTSVLPTDPVWTPIMNAGLFIHCILAYQINMNVWADVVLHLIAPLLKWPKEKASKPGAWIWGLTTLTGILISFLVAAIFPFFSTVAAVMASLGDIAGAYALPAIFVLCIAGASFSRLERNFLKCLIVITFLLSGVGLVVSLYSLVIEFIHNQ